MKRSLALLMLATAVLAWGCSGVGFKKTKTGMEYKIISDGKGRQLKTGDFVKFDYRISYNDSTIAASYGFIPGYDMVDSTPRYHDFSEVSHDMRVGDSIVCFMLYDSLATRGMQMPPYFKKGTKQKMTLKVLAVIDGGREGALADYQKELEKFKDRELAQIERYLADKKISATKVDNSVFVETQLQGTGPKADSGKYVGIKYTGTILETGRAFDSNVDSTKQTIRHDMAPYYFVSKVNGAIMGMLSGVATMNQGGKARIFIPSILGYGPQGSPPAIGPNEKLIFDVELVDVKDSVPPQPGMARMPSREEIEQAAKASGNGDVRAKRLPKNQ